MTTGDGDCQFIAAKNVEAAVAKLVLKAFEPAQLELSKANFQHLENETSAIRNQWKLQLAEAETGAKVAGGLFKQAALQNRHVAGQLQNEWEEALSRAQRIRQAERDLPAPPSTHSVTAMVHKLSTAAKNLDLIWGGPTTSDKDRKHLIRLLIKDVVLLRKPDLTHMTVRWISGGRLELEIPWLSFPASQASQAGVIDTVKDLAPHHTDHAIAL